MFNIENTNISINRDGSSVNIEVSNDILYNFVNRKNKFLRGYNKPAAIPHGSSKHIAELNELVDNGYKLHKIGELDIDIEIYKGPESNASELKTVSVEFYIQKLIERMDDDNDINELDPTPDFEQDNDNDDNDNGDDRIISRDDTGGPSVL